MSQSNSKSSHQDQKKVSLRSIILKPEFKVKMTKRNSIASKQTQDALTYQEPIQKAPETNKEEKRKKKSDLSRSKSSKDKKKKKEKYLNENFSKTKILNLDVGKGRFNNRTNNPNFNKFSQTSRKESSGEEEVKSIHSKKIIIIDEKPNLQETEKIISEIKQKLYLSEEKIISLEKDLKSSSEKLLQAESELKSKEKRYKKMKKEKDKQLAEVQMNLDSVLLNQVKKNQESLFSIELLKSNAFLITPVKKNESIDDTNSELLKKIKLLEETVRSLEAKSKYQENDPLILLNFEEKLDLLSLNENHQELELEFNKLKEINNEISQDLIKNQKERKNLLKKNEKLQLRLESKKKDYESLNKKIEENIFEKNFEETINNLNIELNQALQKIQEYENHLRAVQFEEINEAAFDTQNFYEIFESLKNENENLKTEALRLAFA